MPVALAIIGILANQSKSNQAESAQKQGAAGGAALPAETGSGSLLNNFLSGAMNTAPSAPAQSPTIGQGLSSRDVGAMRQQGVTITDQPIGAQEKGITGAKVGTGGGGGGAGYAQAAGSLLGSLASRPQSAPAGGSVPPGGGGDLASILASLGIQAMAEGGFLQPGETAVVGEGGRPELVQATEGGARVVPASQPASPPASQSEVASVTEPQGPGIAHQIGSTVLNDVLAPILLGRLGLQGHLDAKRAAEANQQNELAKGGVAHPELLESPNVAKATDTVYGAGTSQRIRTANDPDQQALAFGKRIGVKFIPPGTTLPNGTQAPGYSQQIMDAAQNTGQVTVNSKGVMQYKTPSVTLADQGRIAVGNLVQRLKDEEGLDDRAAATKAAAIAHRAGWIVPKETLDLALGSATNRIAAEKAGLETEARKRVEINTARDISREKGLGGREAAVLQPQSEQEFLTSAANAEVERMKTSDNPQDRAALAELGPTPEAQTLARRQQLDLQPASPTFMTRIANNEGAMQTGEAVLAMFDPSQVGPVAGRSKDLKQFLGKMGVSEAQFRAATRAFFNARALVLTGQQRSIKELERIEADTLSNKMNPAAFVSYLAGSLRDAAIGHERDRRILKQNNMRAPAGYLPSEATIEFMKNPGLALKNQWRHQFKDAFTEGFQNYISGKPSAPPTGAPATAPGAPAPVATAPAGTPPGAVPPGIAAIAKTLTAKVNEGKLTREEAADMLRSAQGTGVAP